MYIDNAKKRRNWITRGGLPMPKSLDAILYVWDDLDHNKVCQKAVITRTLELLIHATLHTVALAALLNYVICSVFITQLKDRSATYGQLNFRTIY